MEIDSKNTIRAKNVSFAFIKLLPYISPFRADASRYSEAFHESAIMLSVGFLSGLVTKHAASVTNTFLTSCAWQFWFSTEVLGRFPYAPFPLRE